MGPDCGWYGPPSSDSAIFRENNPQNTRREQPAESGFRYLKRYPKFRLQIPSSDQAGAIGFSWIWELLERFSDSKINMRSVREFYLSENRFYTYLLIKQPAKHACRATGRKWVPLPGLTRAPKPRIYKESLCGATWAGSWIQRNLTKMSCLELLSGVQEHLEHSKRLLVSLWGIPSA